MHGRRRDAEVPLHVQLCWSHAVDLRVRVDERQILALETGESRPHRNFSRRTVGRSAASRASEASGPSECEGGESAATPCSADRRFPATDATGTQRELEAATLSYRQTMSWSIFRPTAIGPPGRRTATSRRPRTVADQNSGRLTHRSAARLHRLRRPRPLHLLVRRRRLPWWHLEPPLKHPGLGPELREVVQGLPKTPEAAPWTAEPFPPVAMPAQCPGKSIASALVERPELAAGD